jgi:hypothetical protein
MSIDKDVVYLRSDGTVVARAFGYHLVVGSARKAS